MSHYFDESPTVGSSQRTVEVTLGDVAFRLLTDRGVFGHGRLDPGTRLLLTAAPPPPSTGHLLDLGCGTGAIAMAMALRSPGAAVWAIDVNERARRLCRANADLNGVTNVTVAHPDDVPDELRWTAIWSNPPIRVGKEALHAVLARWLQRLEPAATALLVVHKHLGSDSLQRWLGEQGWPTERLVSRSGYRLLNAHAAGRRTIVQ